MVKLNKHNREEYTQLILQAIDQQQIEQFRHYFLELHPTDQVELFQQLNEEQRHFVYISLSPTEFAEIFQRIELKEQKEIIRELDKTYMAEIFNSMYSDDLAAFLAELEDPEVRVILDQMDKEEAQEVEELLAYPPETAGAIMTTEFISIGAQDTVAEVMEHLRKEAPDAETIYYLFVTDADSHLVGVLSLRDLITADLNQRVEEIMSTRVVSVPVSMDQEEVAEIISKYDFLAVPVVTPNNVLVGIVTVDDVIDVMEDETTEDFEEMMAAKGTADLDVGSLEAAKRRLPWLILLLIIGMLTAGIIGRFEETLERVAILAFFMPLIAGMAGNTGTQSLAVVVRGLALGKLDRSTVGRLIRREVGTGILIGLVCGLFVSLLSQIVTKGNMYLGFVVGISLFCTLIISTIAGVLVPLIIDKLRIDPAIASGPFITTINDIVALLIYFSIATALISYIQ